MTAETVALSELNDLDQSTFVQVCGDFFEDSPWVAERTWQHRPFPTLQALHDACMREVRSASQETQIALIRAHPDLVGRMARDGRLSAASTEEQKAAGLTDLSSDEIETFEHYNAAYHEKFGFPFVICARENKKDAILQAFPKRLANGRDEEIETALAEIGRIAWLRMVDRLEEA